MERTDDVKLEDGKPGRDPDEVLLDRARGGDRDALEALLARHQHRVYGFGMKMCRDAEDAKDVLQDTLLAAARNVRDFRGASSVSTWLYTIARSFCIKHRRRSKFAPEAEESLEAPAIAKAAHALADPSRAPDESLAGRQVQAALERAVAALDPMYREVLVLRDMEGLTAPEVAEVLGLTVEAVKSRLHRARLAVRETVAPLLGAPGASKPAATPPPAAVSTPAAPAPAATCPDVLR
ncbi:MAG TPA: sigma-70 family RNA polymerase sigma factor, partial [Anaeromyxobacteraceae bacterium]|nr:sigma-70 family RNA polymerase sigma factor [Anaeromyxobacteraceae bacterium]